MGYVTAYKLEAKPLNESTTATISIDTVIKQISGASKINKDKLIQQLQAIKDGGNVIVTADYIIAKLREQNEQASYALCEDGKTCESCKWYEHGRDLREFSKQFPDWLFILSGEGEESGDIWRKYFVNGKMQEAKARITFDDFDPVKLA